MLKKDENPKCRGEVSRGTLHLKSLVYTIIGRRRTRQRRSEELMNERSKRNEGGVPSGVPEVERGYRE